jgi:hypothetical protein
MVLLGLSSGTAPDVCAAELADMTTRGGGAAVDVRIGKGHAWEDNGVRQGIADIERAGVSVAFTGIGWHMGDPVSPVPHEWPPAQYPVKVFCVERPDHGLVAEQVAAAARSGVTLLIETHRGGPSATELARLAATSGVGVVADLLGLLETGSDEDSLAELAPHVRAVQVKGVTPQRRHRPMVPQDLAPVRRLLTLGAPVRAITVESRAGRPLDDLALLAETVQEVHR